MKFETVEVRPTQVRGWALSDIKDMADTSHRTAGHRGTRQINNMKIMPSTDGARESDEFWEQETVERAVRARDEELASMLGKAVVRLPVAPDVKALVRNGKLSPKSPVKPSGTLDFDSYDYYLVGMPMSILTPDMRLVRFRLTLRFANRGGTKGAVVVHDLAPKDETSTRTWFSGEAELDISKSLEIVFPPLAAANPLGFNVKAPFSWTTRNLTVQTTGRMSNPADWYVTDTSIEQGFAGYCIVRAPRGARLGMTASFVGELRRRGVAGWFTSAQFRTQDKRYDLVQ